MPKFNKSIRKRISELVPFGPNVMNRAGGLSYQDEPLMALYRQVATSLWSGDGYYERQEEWFDRFQENVRAAAVKNLEFPFKLAAYGRDKQGLALRTSPIGLYVEAASLSASKGTGLIRKYAPKVLRRADEPAEAIAYFKRYHKGNVPHGLLRGIADTLTNFDEYQLAKYRKGGQITLRDVMRLARPKPKTEEERDLWRRAVAGELQTPFTWEVELSRARGNDEKREVWNKLIKSKKLGIFALVRNVRNILKVNADIEEALSQITEERVRGSGILPFQWYKAYKTLLQEGQPEIAKFAEQALEWSISEVPKLPGITLIAADNSGSMKLTFQTHGTSNTEIANLMAAMGLYISDTGYAGSFGDYFEIADTRLDSGLMGNKRHIDRCGQRTGNSTNAWRIFQYLIRSKIYVDRVIILSDMQCYDSSTRYEYGYGGHSLSEEFKAYRKINPGCAVYSVNLATQDNSTQFEPGLPVVSLAGFSESVFQFISAMEVGESIINHVLENY